MSNRETIFASIKSQTTYEEFMLEDKILRRGAEPTKDGKGFVTFEQMHRFHMSAAYVLTTAIDIIDELQDRVKDLEADVLKLKGRA